MRISRRKRDKALGCSCLLVIAAAGALLSPGTGRRAKGPCYRTDPPAPRPVTAAPCPSPARRPVRRRFAERFDYCTRTVDGDTIRVREGDRIRLIGVDTPETKHPRRPVEPFGKEASAFTREAVEHRDVRLEADTRTWKRDRYGRLLAYVYRRPDDFLLNAELLKGGYARAYLRFPFSRRDEFADLERAAREKELGLWSFSP